ncbi:phenylpyruvate tautomerase MIF-related protein [Maridesulfovibrio bastinii]|jgi:phenylpyruvate tautomerase|uniref:phenylpyruvate tautomerase MIF-related protein n=1 Tax=Maridesulfovibrio bastinii TaxID=47157 RepID=UPI0004097C70|nr:phenylpyruvate tautomerase MIF-related protein [Maridesulfovibrio bastinii]
MPFCRIETNLNITDDSKENLASTVSEIVATALAKPEARVMVLVADKMTMSFGATATPTALVTLGSIGLSKEQRCDLSEKICSLLDINYGISGKRVYIDFRDLERSNVGWDGSTF